MAHTLQCGDKEIGIKGSPISLLFYKQEFKRNALEDIMAIIDGYDLLVVMQLVWAMNKAYSFGSEGASFPAFEEWLAAIDCIDLGEEGLSAIMTEIAQGFFRGQLPDAKPGRRRSRK